MNIPMMITADYATVDPITEKLHILGTFRNINAEAFPCQHKRMCLALIIEGEIDDSGNPHELSVTLIDEDGAAIFSMQGGFEMPRGLGGIPPHCNFILEFNDLQFEKPGEYRFHVQVNGDEAEGSAVVQVVRSESGN